MAVVTRQLLLSNINTMPWKFHTEPSFLEAILGEEDCYTFAGMSYNQPFAGKLAKWTWQDRHRFGAFTRSRG